MYRIKRNIYKHKKPLWMESLLFNVMPSWYDPQPSKEECKKNLKAILGVIKGYSYIWHRQYSKIEDFCKLVVYDDYIKVLSNKGGLFLSFVIIECEDKELKVK